MAIQINTAAVNSAADYINDVNNSIRKDLLDVDISVKSLRNTWDGEAASKCVNKYSYIKDSYDYDRYIVIDNLVSFMKVQVSEVYENIDRTMTKAASSFK